MLAHVHLIRCVGRKSGNEQRVKIRVSDSDSIGYLGPDSARQKTLAQKSEEISCFDVLEVLFGVLEVLFGGLEAYSTLCQVLLRDLKSIAFLK